MLIMIIDYDDAKTKRTLIESYEIHIVYTMQAWYGISDLLLVVEHMLPYFSL